MTPVRLAPLFLLLAALPATAEIQVKGQRTPGMHSIILTEVPLVPFAAPITSWQGSPAPQVVVSGGQASHLLSNGVLIQLNPMTANGAQASAAAVAGSPGSAAAAAASSLSRSHTFSQGLYGRAGVAGTTLTLGTVYPAQTFSGSSYSQQPTTAAGYALQRSHAYSQNAYKDSASAARYFGPYGALPYVMQTPATPVFGQQGRMNARESAAYSVNRAHAFSQNAYRR